MDSAEEKIVKKLEKDLDKAHAVMDKLVLKLDKKDRELFNKTLKEIVDLNIELETYCNQ